MKKFDAHAHIGCFGSWAVVDATPEAMVAMMDDYDIEKSVICPTTWSTNTLVEEAHAYAPKRLLPLAWVNPLQNGAQEVDHWVGEKGFIGVKLHPLFDAYAADDPAVDPIMERAKALHVPVFIHSGHVPFATPWQIALLAERHPEVRVVMIHMGHGHGIYIQAAIEMAKRYDNLWLEMSGMPMPSKIKEAYEEVGADRIFFGTDFPFHAPQVEIDKVAFSGLDDVAQQRIFYDNIKSFLDL